MKLEVLQYPDPRLKLKSEEIAEVTPEIRELAERMAEAMYEHDGIGLAAPQVGRQIRMIVVDLSGPDERSALNVYINPKVEPLEGELVESEEGCLSVADYRSQVKRPGRVRFTATDLDGNRIEKEAHELEAICLQHECDHLDGKLFIDHISRLKRGLYDSKVKKALKAKAAQ
ncbi:peptide deformylase [Desulfovibrio sp. OttesenSCG-928-C14]|nr:peptide deformylase [Desulfovibrio sp. OttesenSCG-928-C14]